MSFKLGALGDFKNGANYPKDSYGSGFKIVNVKDLFKGHFIDFEELEELKPEVLKNPKQYQVLDGDLLFTRSSLVQSGTGMVAMAHHPHDFVVYCGFIIRFRPNKDLVDPTYLTYLLRSKKYREIFINLASQTTITNINQKTLSEFEVDLPDLSIQKTISSLLKQYDDKIELNNRMNKTLEEMAQTIFKRWFVDFEFPDENGIPYKSSGGKMVESELGLIPEGWRVKCLYDFAQYINGTSFKKEEIQPVGVPIIKIAEIKNGISNTTNRFAGEKDKKYYLKRGDILFSWSGNPDTSIGIYVWPYDEKSVLNQHIFKVKTSDEMLVFTYFLLNYFMPQFAEIARNKQTTGLGHVTVADLKRMQHVYSTQNIFKLFDEIVGPIFDRYKQNIYENQYLTQLRDTLLPKFMSGEIRIPVMEETN